MSYQTVFKRYELKYILTKEQKDKVLEAMNPYMHIDEYGKTTIRNIYYDTDNFRLIRSSIESPVYKEKLRVRSYSKTSGTSIVFVELKKKYDSVVYKRRLPLLETDAVEWLDYKHDCIIDCQISKEIDYFFKYYQSLKPKIFLSYDREAYYANNNNDFRITFDANILYREKVLSLQSSIWGKPILDDNSVLMEIKCSDGIPLWLTSTLSENGIYKTSFSKYGMAYKNMIGG